MNRRELLGLVMAAGAHSATIHSKRSYIDPRTGKGPYEQVSAKQGGEQRDIQRPNVFLISADMVSPDFYHPARPMSREMNLPAIRGLMNDGVFCSNAFCTVPVCAPSRASYLTGRYSYITGNGERAPEGLETELRSDDVIWPEYLKASGYVTRHAGKCHVGTKKFLDAFGENDHPWNRWSPPIYDDDSYLEYLSRLGVQRQKYAREIVLLQQDRKTPGNSLGGWIEQADGKPFPIEAQYSYFLGQKACADVEELSSNPETRGRPIYYQLDLFDPHQPLSIPAGFEKRENELRRLMSLPKTYDRVRANDWRRFNDQPDIYDVYRRYWGLYQATSLTDYRVGYALQMELVDQVIGMFIDRLKKLGLYENSLLFFISDHGEMNGRWALVDKGTYLYPDVLRVPLVIKPPVSLRAQPQQISSPVSLMDVGPTALEAAGIRPEAKFDGQSLLPLITGAAKPTDRDLLFFGGWHVGVNFACGLQRWKADGSHHLYAYNCSSSVDELYDLNAVEAENLAGVKEHAELRKLMVEQLAGLLRKDTRWGGYWAEFRVAQYDSLPPQAGDMQLFGVSK